MMKKIVSGFLSGSLLALFSLQAISAATPLPNQFIAGQKARSSEVNENFQELADRIEILSQSVGAGSPGSFSYKSYLPADGLVKTVEYGDGTLVEVEYQQWDEDDVTVIQQTRTVRAQHNSGDADSRWILTAEFSDSKGLRLREESRTGDWTWNNGDVVKNKVYRDPLTMMQPVMRVGDVWVADSKKDWFNESDKGTGYVIRKYTVIGVEDIWINGRHYENSLKILREGINGWTVVYLAPGLGEIKRGHKHLVTSADTSDTSLDTDGFWRWVKSYQYREEQVTQSGVLLLSPKVEKGVEIVSAELWEGSSRIDETTEMPFSLQALLTHSDNGSHTYTIKTYNSFGDVTESTHQVDVAIKAPDTVDPTVSLTASSSMISMADTVTLEAAASDDKGINRVEFWHDGEKLYTDRVYPYRWDLYLNAMDWGVQGYKAVVYDSAGNSAEDTTTINVAIGNEPGSSSQTGSAAAKAMIAQFRGDSGDVTDKGWIGKLEGLESPANQFADRIEVANKISKVSFDQLGEELAELVAMMGETWAKGADGIRVTGSGTNGLYAYNIPSVSQGELTVTEGDSYTTIVLDESASNDALTLVLPRYDSLKCCIKAELSGVVSTTDAKATLHGGTVAVKLHDAIHTSRSGIDAIDEVEFGQLFEYLRFSVDGKLEAALNSSSPVTFEGPMDFKVLAKLVNDGGYGGEYEPRPYSLVMQGTFSDSSDSFAARLQAKWKNADSFMAASQHEPGYVFNDIATYDVSSDQRQLTINFIDGGVFTYTLKQSSGSSRWDTIAVSQANPDWQHSWENRYGNSNFSTIIEAIAYMETQSYWPANSGTFTPQYWYGTGGVSDGDEVYGVALPSSQISLQGGTVSGVLLRSEGVGDENQYRYRKIEVDLEFVADLDNKEDVQVLINLDRTGYERADLEMVLAHDDLALRVNGTVDDSNNDSNDTSSSPRGKGVLTFINKDGVEMVIDLDSKSSTIGVIKVKGVKAAELEELSSGIKVKYTDGSSSEML